MLVNAARIDVGNNRIAGSLNVTGNTGGSIVSANQVGSSAVCQQQQPAAHRIAKYRRP